MQFARALSNEFSLLEAVVAPIALALTALWVVLLGGFANWLFRLLTG